ncbi:uncharacterized protein DNG_10034 [Cephalotrichum gorgonifer]|uniref:Heterokaryon incompatibility domain-containing protein n=1 Tax=Cephalotrichum gorgonifer TaxID=2041049 RepID=A0AAE8N6U2_9PEZI|nr:uncharacterized protein DNG_10034 [Cephalotrichum gorgonifer]
MPAGREPNFYDSDDLQLGHRQIRLLTISPSPASSHDGPIQCSLQVVDLDHPPEYYALSYTWGVPAEYGPLSTMTDDSDCLILCNTEALTVTPNLHGALRRLRHIPRLAGKAFWVDAVCINQQDQKERGDQVRLMAYIYRSAASVVSWLGEEDEHTEPGFALLRELKSVSDRTPHLMQVLAGLSPDSGGYGEQLAVFSNRQAWVAVAHVFQRTYFTRAWIIQEVVLAPAVSVLCGCHELPWSAMAEASHFLSTSVWRHHLYGLFVDSVGSQLGHAEEHPAISFRYQAPTTLRSTTKEYNKRQQQPYHPENRHEWARTLLYTLIKARNFKTRDPRDKIYSLLGLVNEYAQDKPGLIPTYELEDSHAAAATYVDAAIQILEDSDDLLLLSCVEGETFQNRATGRLPSWVPDWTFEGPIGLRVTGYERYFASGDSKQRPSIDRRALTLSLRGIRLDRVTMVGETKRDILNGKPFPEWLDIFESLDTLYDRVRAEHKLDVFWRTLIGNTAGYPPKLVPRSRSLGPSFAKWFHEVRWVRGQGHPQDEWDSRADRFSDLLDQEWDPRIRDAANVSDFASPFASSQHLRLFRTSEGYLGLGTECLHVGDSVWIVPGSRVPLILRTSGDDEPRESRYRLVGGAYLHNFMEGEALSPSVTGVTPRGVEMLMESFTLE